jgi:hypothetical protein
MATNKIAAQRQSKANSHQPVDAAPGCAFGLVTRKGLDDLTKDFERLEGKINGIIFGVVVTVLLQAWKTLG